MNRKLLTPFLAFAFAISLFFGESSFAKLSAQNVNIPDPIFKQELLKTGIDSNNDGEISNEEALELKSLEIFSKEIKSIEGIAAFTNLSSLKLSDTKLEAADLSENSNLEMIEISYTDEFSNIKLPQNSKVKKLNLDECHALNILDLSQQAELQEISILYCTGILSLDYSANKKLEALKISYSGITDLKFQADSEIKELWISGLNLSETLDLSPLKKLSYLSAGRLGLKSIDLSKTQL